MNDDIVASIMSRTYSLSDLKKIKPATLRSWFRGGLPNGEGKFAVIDVRESDYVGGHIRGCYHYPAGQFADTLPNLRERLFNNKINDVVFHCALSQARGPSSSLKFLRSLNEVDDPSQIEFFNNINVWVLFGGFNRWQAEFGEDEAVTEGYDKELWGFSNSF